MNKKLLVILILFLFVFSSCKENEKCEHVYINGICEKCNKECPHECFEDDVCLVCGLTFQEACHHDFDNGLCNLCGFRCKHNYVDGVCNVCGHECNHSRLDNGICKICGLDYRTVCKHDYQNGVCTICTFKCDHGDTPCGDICDICKAEAGHRLVGGKCTMCDYEEKFTATAIPDLYLGDCPNKGTVEITVFESYDYAKKINYENTFFAYLPYGYDENDDKEYNILYLLHGSGENAAYWLAQLGYKGGVTEKTKILLDNMHYYNLCEDTIVITPTSNLNGTANFYKELLNQIMPLAETKYKTKAHLYGKDINTVTNEDFIASRDSRAYAGLSRGSMIGWSILAYDLPYFGYFGFYSGGSYGLTQYYNDSKNTVLNSEYDVLYAYHSCGNDAMYNNHLEEYNGLLEASKGRLVEGKNTNFLPKPSFGHTYGAWIIDLYNSLGYAFFK